MSRELSYILWLLTFLLSLRVLGQAIVCLWRPRWLPPMEQWHSGIVPYRTMLPTQIVVLTLMSWAAADFFRGAGVFVVPKWDAAWTIVWFSYVYGAGMVVRYVITRARRPDQRWRGGTIPIVFHGVVAAFLYVFGRYHTL
jgi:uncharacterized protein